MKRTAYEIIAAALVSFALSALLPALPLGGVRGMLVVLPVVGALFASVGRSVAGSRPSAIEGALWGGWVLLALQHFSLGFPGSSEVVAAAGMVLAGSRTLALAVRLRRPIGRPTLWPFFALPLALYLFVWPWTTTARAPDGDEPYYLLLTHSLAEDFDVDLADEYRDQAWRSFTTVPVAPQPGDPAGPGGAIYSRHSALLPLALAPLYLLAGPFGAQLGMLALAAAAAAAGFAAARARFPDSRRGVLGAWAILAFAPPLLLYAGQFWVEVPAALLVALVCRSLARLQSAPRPTPAPAPAPTRRELLALALPLIALPLLKLRFLALALPLGALAAARLRASRPRRRELLLLAALAAMTLLGLGLWNFWRYGNPLRMYAGSDLAIFDVPLREQLRGDFGLFFDIAFGLFALSPIWLLLLPGVARSLRRRGTEWVALAPVAEIAALLPYLLLIGMRREWYGGWSPPFRYGVAVLPALALALPPLLASKRLASGKRWLFAALATLSSLVALTYLVHPAWAYSLANGSSRLLDELSHDFPGDLVRLFPSMVRARPATWIVPVVISFTVLALGALPPRGQRRRTHRLRFRHVWPLAAAALLLAWSGVLVAAHRLPTSRIEFEDAWVSHRGGALYPERWTLDRTRFDGGWALRHDAEVSVRPVTGGSECRLAIRLRPTASAQAPPALEVRAGSRIVAVVTAPAPPAALTGDAKGAADAASEPPWVTLETAPFGFTDGDVLSFRAIGPTVDGARSLFVLDRAELFWR